MGVHAMSSRNMASGKEARVVDSMHFLEASTDKRTLASVRRVRDNDVLALLSVLLAWFRECYLKLPTTVTSKPATLQSAWLDIPPHLFLQWAPMGSYPSFV